MVIIISNLIDWIKRKTFYTGHDGSKNSLWYFTQLRSLGVAGIPTSSSCSPKWYYQHFNGCGISFFFYTLTLKHQLNEIQLKTICDNLFLVLIDDSRELFVGIDVSQVQREATAELQSLDDRILVPPLTRNIQITKPFHPWQTCLKNG